MKPTIAALILSLASRLAGAFCFEDAGQRYGVAPELLRAIAKVESSMNASAVNGSHAARTGSTDLGLMQINSSHLPRLAQWGITREALMTDACLNVMVGAWLLVQHMDRNGQDWNGIGSYNAACSQLKGQACTTARNTYAWKVYRALKRMPSQDEPGRKPPAQLANNKPRPSIGSVELVIGEQVAQLGDMNTETR